MVLTRPRRKLLFGVVLGVLMAAVTIAVLWWQRDPISTVRLTGYPVARFEQHRMMTFGLTQWLVIDSRIDSAGRVVDTRASINAPGLMESLTTLVFATLAAWWTWRVLIARLAQKGRCDWCGYDLTGLTSSRCPECGHAVAAAETSDASVTA